MDIFRSTDLTVTIIFNSINILGYGCDFIYSMKHCCWTFVILFLTHKHFNKHPVAFIILPFTIPLFLLFSLKICGFLKSPYFILTSILMKLSTWSCIFTYLGLLFSNWPCVFLSILLVGYLFLYLRDMYLSYGQQYFSSPFSFEFLLFQWHLCFT